MNRCAVHWCNSGRIYAALKVNPAPRKRERQALSVGRGAAPSSNLKTGNEIRLLNLNAYRNPQDVEVDSQKEKDEHFKGILSPREQDVIARNKIQKHTITNFKQNILSEISGWNIFRKQKSKEEELQEEKQRILMAAFIRPEDITDYQKEKIEVIDKKI